MQLPHQEELPLDLEGVSSARVPDLAEEEEPVEEEEGEIQPDMIADRCEGTKDIEWQELPLNAPVLSEHLLFWVEHDPLNLIEIASQPDYWPEDRDLPKFPTSN